MGADGAADCDALVSSLLTGGLEYHLPKVSGRMQVLKKSSDFSTQSDQKFSSGTIRSM